VTLERPGPSRVSLLPTAAAFERPDRAIANGTQYLEALGVAVEVIEIYSRSDAFDDDKVALLERTELLYCIGGSPLHLRSVFTQSPALAAISMSWSKGMTLVASSASAMVLGDPMIDPRGGALTIGLGLIPDLAVLPHADQRSQSIRERTIHLVHAPIVMVEIDAQTALLYDHNRGVEVIGSGDAAAYQDGHPVDLLAVADLLDRRTFS
jgi:cyanophycinase